MHHTICLQEKRRIRNEYTHPIRIACIAINQGVKLNVIFFVYFWLIFYLESSFFCWIVMRSRNPQDQFSGSDQNIDCRICHWVVTGTRCKMQITIIFKLSSHFHILKLGSAGLHLGQLSFGFIGGLDPTTLNITERLDV